MLPVYASHSLTYLQLSASLLMLVLVLLWLFMWMEAAVATASGNGSATGTSGAKKNRKKRNNNNNRAGGNKAALAIAGAFDDDNEEVESEEQLLVEHRQVQPKKGRSSKKKANKPKLNSSNRNVVVEDSLDGLSAKNVECSSARSSLSQANDLDLDDDDDYSDRTDSDGDAGEREDDGDYFSSESEEEEGNSYKPGGYHPVQVGQVYKSRFHVLEKLGWGHFSTVWKCLDKETGEIVAMKVQKSARHYTEAAQDEIELLQCTVKAATAEDTLANIKVVRLIDSFDHAGPHGIHVCMVFEMLGDNLLTLIKYYNYRGIPMPLVKRLSKDILEALAFLHTKCSIIHTDLKPENVLLSHHIPRLPRLQRTEFLQFNSSSSNQQRQPVNKNSVNPSAELSRDEKKKLKKKQKKKQKKQNKNGNEADELDAAVAAAEAEAAAISKLKESLAQLEIDKKKKEEAENSKGENLHDVLLSNFWTEREEQQPGSSVSKENGGRSDTVNNSSKTRKAASRNDDDDEDDWVHLPPEFASRVMLLLPDGRVTGSRKKEIEFTITIPPQHLPENAEEVRTSFALRYGKRDIAVTVPVKYGLMTAPCLFAIRYLDRVGSHITVAMEEGLSAAFQNDQQSGAANSANGHAHKKMKLWKVEFDARYLAAILGSFPCLSQSS